MPEPEPVAQVHVVDDDDAVRDSILELFASIGLEATGYRSATDFLAHSKADVRGVMVLDIRMPGMSGLDLQKEMQFAGYALPIIFITGHGDVPMAVEAMRQGAVDFIQKPFRDQDLLDRVQVALTESTQAASQDPQISQARAALETLTVREQEVLDWIANGHPNKVIAGKLGISQRTVENHRASILKKMNARSTAALVKLMMIATRPE